MEAECSKVLSRVSPFLKMQNQRLLVENWCTHSGVGVGGGKSFELLMLSCSQCKVEGKGMCSCDEESFSFHSSPAQNEGVWSLLGLCLGLALAWCKAQPRICPGNFWEGLNWEWEHIAVVCPYLGLWGCRGGSKSVLQPWHLHPSTQIP